MFDAKTIRLAESLRPDLDFSVLGTEEFAILKIVENATGGGVVPVYDADISNGIASFSGVTKSKPLVSLLLNIPVTQTGSGTPSPINVREFIGVSGANIGQTSDYGKFFRGLLNGTYGFVDMGDLNWLNYSSGINTFRATVPNKAFGDANLICSCYKTEVSSFTDMTNNTIRGANGNNYIYVRDNSYEGKTGTDFKQDMTGQKIIYELAAPVTPTITPQQFATLCQAFGITGNIYQISFGQTVYSAYLDVLAGKLSITHKIVDLGDLEWKYTSATTRFYTDDITDISLEANFTDMFCSGYNAISSANSFANMPDKSIKRGTSSSQISLRDLDYTDADDFTTAVTGMKLVYELAEPIEIDLTPTVINTLIGNNVIFADVGDITECKYTRK